MPHRPFAATGKAGAPEDRFGKAGRRTRPPCSIAPTASGDAGESESGVEGGVPAGCLGGEFVMARGFVELVLLKESVGQLQKGGSMTGLERHGLLQQVELLLFVSLLLAQQRLAVYPLRVAGSQAGGNPIRGGGLLEIIIGVIGHGEFADRIRGCRVPAGILIGADQQVAKSRAHRPGIGQLGKIGRHFHGKQSARKHPRACGQNGGQAPTSFKVPASSFNGRASGRIRRSGNREQPADFGRLTGPSD